jgi:hypothetical protein
MVVVFNVKLLIMLQKQGQSMTGDSRKLGKAGVKGGKDGSRGNAKATKNSVQSASKSPATATSPPLTAVVFGTFTVCILCL